MLKVTFKNMPDVIDDVTPFFGSPSLSNESFLAQLMKIEDEMSDNTEEPDVLLLNENECVLRQYAVRKHQVQVLQFFSNQPSLTSEVVEEDDDELEYYFTKHEDYEFQVLANEPIRSQMKPNFIYIYNASDRRIAYKTFAPNQDHVSNESKKIVKDYISTDNLSDFKYPLTPVNLSPCLEDIIDITKERGHTPGYDGEYPFSLVFKK